MRGGSRSGTRRLVAVCGRTCWPVRVGGGRDQALALELAEAALKVAGCLLTHHGTLLVKVFEGETTTAFRHQVQERFERHVSRKPAASRNESRERYVIATNPLTGPSSGLEKQ